MAARIRKGDRVIVITGVNKGRQGEVATVLPKENRAIVSGVRYITNSPPIKIVLLRTLVMGLIGGAIMASIISCG